MSEFAYLPDQPAIRPTTWGPYNPHQAALWQALSEAYQARANGWEQTRQAMPGAWIDPVRYAKWKETLRERWEYEARRDSTSRGLAAEDFQEGTLQCLYQDMIAAEPLRPAPAVQQTIDYDD